MERIMQDEGEGKVDGIIEVGVVREVSMNF